MTKSIDRGGGRPGNQNAVKLSTTKLKNEAYNQYCDHIARGGSKNTWYFEHPKLTLSYKTMDKYIAENPVDFDATQLDIAKSKGLEVWERRGIRMLKGGGSPAVYQIMMRNKYGWDKDNTEHKQDNKQAIAGQFEVVENKGTNGNQS